MSLLAKNTGGGDFELAPTGNHRARCYGVVDLGMQRREWSGEVNYKHIVRISWELPDELMSDGRPFSITQNYTLSLSDKANLRKDLESWRGRSFTEAELEGFDLKNMIGVPAMVNVVHRESNGKTYANVGSVSPLPKGLECPPAVNDPLYFSLDEPGWEVIYKGLPEWLQNKINCELPEDEPPVLPDGVKFIDDDIPF